MTASAIISLIISVIGAFLGTLSFYLTQIRKPKIYITVEKRIRIGYTNGNGFQLYIPVTFINKTHQTGIVYKMSLCIFDTQAPEAIFKLDVSRFSEINSERTGS